MKVFFPLSYLFIFLLYFLACFWSDQLIGSSCFSSRFLHSVYVPASACTSPGGGGNLKKKKSLNRFLFLNNLHSNRHPPPPPSSCCPMVCSLSLSRRPLGVTSCFGDTFISSPPAWRHSSRLGERGGGVGYQGGGGKERQKEVRDITPPQR